MFSDLCLVICKYRAARQHLNCSRLYSLNRQCQKQIANRQLIPPKCNKRFFSREELVDQVAQELVRRIANRQLIPPKCNKRFFSREELVDQVAQELVRRKDAEEKERYWHNKYHSEALVVDEENSADLDSMF